MNGLLIVNKEKDYTSFDVVAKLRGILKQKKIGHTGTLDPMAVGVLPVCLGNATKLCDILTDHDKVYEAVMLLGVTYDTLDVSGTKLTEHKVMSTDKEITDVIKFFIGGYEQIPPMYSAKKVNGQKLCDLARSGAEVDRKPVRVDIYDISITDISLPRVSIRVHCGKGTYIRSLIDDIGKKLGCGAAMESLARTRVGIYDIADALTLAEIEQLRDEGRIEERVIGTDSVFIKLRAASLPKEFSKIIDNGNVFNADNIKLLKLSNDTPLSDGEKIRIYDCDGKFRAVYFYDRAKDVCRPYKMFVQ